jgi:signal peptidase I
MYIPFWCFRTWKYVRDASKEKLSPGWRAIGMAVPGLGIVMSYLLFRRIFSRSSRIVPVILALLFGIVPFIFYWPPFIWLLIFPISIAQHELNLRWSQEMGEWHWGEIFASALLILLLSPFASLASVFLIRTYLFSPFFVSGNAMNDTLFNDELILVNRWIYRVSEPQRGDIVVYYPVTDSSRHFLHRIIGLPSETVIIRDGNVFIQHGSGTPSLLNEPYLNEESVRHTFRYPVNSRDSREEIYQVPPGEYFLLGDNREHSLDSRSFRTRIGESFPFVPKTMITGKVSAVLLPITSFTLLRSPSY